MMNGWEKLNICKSLQMYVVIPTYLFEIVLKTI
jgi:hypothetical protein